MFGLSLWQLLLLITLYIPFMIVTGRTMSKTKQENINRILDIRVEQGMCSVCLEREWKKLKEMSAIDVEIALWEIKQERKQNIFYD